jgi:hypothetical protein
MLSHNAHYTYRPHPYQSGSFQIFLMQGFKQNPVADYLLLDREEPADLAEKTVMNLMTLLNGRDDLIDLSAETNSTMTYERLQVFSDEPRARILFRTHRADGQIRENALLTYDPEKMNV